jgi:hypothetical protein
MDDEHDRPRRQYPVSPAKMSKTPSWVMLGFVLGALTVVSLPPLRKEKEKPPVPSISATKAEPARKEEGPRSPPQVSTIEAVFEEWAKGAVWDADTTEVALWSPTTRDFTEYFEVLRYANRYYFRTIPTLTRRVINRGKPVPNCPLLFTETEEQYQEWRQHGRSERPFGDYRPVSAFPNASDASGKPTTPRLEVIAPKFEVIAPIETPKFPGGDAKK